MRVARVTLTAISALVLLAAVFVAFGISSHREFQVDEVQHIHVAYNVATGRLPYQDFHDGHNPLLHTLLRIVVDPADPLASFLSARWLSFSMLLGTVAVSAWCARRIAGNTAAAVACAALLFQTTFIERGMEVRPDIALSLMTAIALLWQLSNHSAGRRFVVQALCLGTAFVFTQKAVFACVAFGCIWVLDALRYRRLRLVALPVVAFCTPVLVMILGLALWGNLEDYARVNLIGAAAQATGRASAFSPWPYLRLELGRNQVFWVAAMAAMAHAAVVGLRRGPDPEAPEGPIDEQRRLRAVAWLGAVLTASIWLNPFPFSYVQVTVIPTLAVLIAALVARVPLWRRIEHVDPLRPALVLVWCIAAGWTATPRLLYKAVRRVDYQLATLAEVDRITSPDDCVFDLVGLYFRPDAYPVFNMTGVMIERYAAGVYPRMIPELRERGVTLVINNYRTEMLPNAERDFLKRHFVHYAGDIHVQGTDLLGLAPGDRREFEVLRAKTFEYVGEGTLLVDGRPFVRGVLERGGHVLTAADPIPRGRLAMSVPRPVPERLSEPEPLYINFD